MKPINCVISPFKIRILQNVSNVQILELYIYECCTLLKTKSSIHTRNFGSKRTLEPSLPVPIWVIMKQMESWEHENLCFKSTNYSLNSNLSFATEIIEWNLYKGKPQTLGLNILVNYHEISPETYLTQHDFTNNLLI